MGLILFSVNEAPSFVIKPENQETIEGNSNRFLCKVRGKPLPEISWLRDQQTILEDENVLISSKKKEDKLEVESVLDLKNVQAGDENDTYKIEAENAEGAVSHTFALTVNKPPEFLTIPSAVELIEGEPSELKAVATGRPLPDIVWYKDNTEIVDGEVADVENVQADGESRSTLSADPVQLSHDGKYKIKATNCAGSVKAEFPMTGTYNTVKNVLLTL